MPLKNRRVLLTTEMRHGYCPSNENSKSACQRFQTQSPYVPAFEPQWNVLLSTEGRKGSCLGTVVNQSIIFANPTCLNERTRIIYPEKVSKSKVKIPSPQTTGRKFSAAELSPEPEFLPTFHEINAPYKEVCGNNDCALFVSAFDPESHRMRLLPARQSSPDHCNLSPVDLSNEIVCLELIKDPSGHQQCLNMDGATVAVKNGNAYYLFGLLSDGQFSPKNEKHCDQNATRYCKYHKLCGHYHI
uniref:Peptidase S1 domain-containing protein n=1 Tax=Romanomermis culicivorax TaxID=13658 RepID=A0A915ISN2_ROMCU